MAQTGYTPILIYSSSTASNLPSASNLTNSALGSELAINITDGKLFYKDNANAIQVIGWKTTPTTAGGTGLTSYTAGDMLYYASGTALSKLSIGASGAYMSSSGTAPQWTAPAALTKTDDTNVTLTLGGSASTALLNAASLTLGWTGQLATSRGGTGLSSFTANAVLYASSTSALATSSNFVTDGTRIGLNTSVLGWFSTFKGIDFEGGSLVYQGTGASFLTQNAFLNTSVQWKYRVNGTAAYYTQNTSGEHAFFVAGSGTAGNTISWTQAATIKNNADVSIDTGNLVIGTSGKGVTFGNITQYYANASGVTTTNTDEVGALNRNTVADGVILRYQKQGSTVGYISTNTYSLPSDERVKKNIVPISLGLEFLLDLEPIEYNTIFQDPQNESRKNFGLKAQQVEAALKKHGKTVNDVTFLEKFEEYKEGESQYGLGYQNLVPVLIQAVHQLQAQIDELKGAQNVAN